MPGRRRVFVACEGDAKLVVLDLVGRRVTGVMDVGDAPDVMAVDPGTHLVYLPLTDVRGHPVLRELVPA